MGTDTNPPGAQPLENIAQTLARELPTTHVAHTQHDANAIPAITHVAVPKNFTLVAIDDEPLLAHPRHIKALAVMGDEVSFVEYANRNKAANSILWVAFNPQTYELGFTAVFDEHAGMPEPADDLTGSVAAARPGWRKHKAAFSPAMSLEWQRWTAGSGKWFDQIPWAEFLQNNELDIYPTDGYPDSARMFQIATEFVARADMSAKSVVRLQTGGCRLEYINDPTGGTVDNMEVPGKFMIAIPVFWGVKNAPDAEGKVTVPAYRIEARLKYKLLAGTVKFSYELIRPDLKHELAALELIGRIREGVGDMPVMLGHCA